MTYTDANKYLNKLELMLNLQDLNVTITEIQSPANVPFIGDRTDENRHAIPYPPSTEQSRTSGVYLFVSEHDEVLYVGKATKNNMRVRIWDHIKTPEDSEEKEGWVIYPNNHFDQDIVRSGMVKIAIFKVEPAQYCSLAEVYLQTMDLPKYCQQIG